VETTILEKLQALPDELRKELNTLTTAGEVMAFAKRAGISLTSQEAEEIATMLPDDALDEAAGGWSFTQSFVTPPGLFW